MALALPDPQLPSSPNDALQSIQRNFEAIAQTLAPPVPTGTVLPYAAATAPDGYLICDGSEVSVEDYPALDALLGTTYGGRTNGSGGSGTSHFRLPNLRGRVAVGRDSADTDFDTLGETRGSKTHTLTTAEMPSHNHGVYFKVQAAAGTGESNPGTVNDNIGNTGTTNTGGGQAHNNIQPSMVLNYIIKA